MLRFLIAAFLAVAAAGRVLAQVEHTLAIINVAVVDLAGGD
jgi:hypothetical protein